MYVSKRIDLKKSRQLPDFMSTIVGSEKFKVYDADSKDAVRCTKPYRHPGTLVLEHFLSFIVDTKTY